MSLFDPQSETLIRQWNQAVKKPIPIQLLTTGHEQDHQFVNFARHMAEMTSNLKVESKKGDVRLPGFLLKKNITWSALPLAKELEPFLEALSQLDAGPPQFTDPVLEPLDTLDIPVRLTLYIALECPFCPKVVRTVVPLALYCSRIQLHIIDGSLFSETAQKDRVMSAPCLVLDDDFRWTGSVTAQEIVKMITSRDPGQLSPDTLKNILEQGDAAWIARQMIQRKIIFDSFVALLLHDTWSVRLGAMVVVEELAQADPELAGRLGSRLMETFDGRSVPVQGDILYALGETGTLETRQWIMAKLPLLVHQDLTDAAREALDTLTSRYP